MQSYLSYLISWLTGSECHWFISLPGSCINHVSSGNQQYVSNTAWFLCHAVSSTMSHPMTNREWVTLLYFLARQSHQSCLIWWPTVCEWLYFFAMQSHQSCLIPWPTGSEWCCFISLPGSPISHMTHISSYDHSQWVTLLFFFAQYFTIPWPTDCKPYEVCQQAVHSSCVSFYDQQSVSNKPSLLVIFFHMTNSLWVRKHLFFIRQSHFILSHDDQQEVGDMLLSDHITSYCMSNRM